ncbi:MAG: hypothetical protein DMF95_31835 [Acidobacteria bacterium]|nr:MAG: hypothetical protein DMF95_31835 [Acidobacteriota bacterium]
MSAVFSKLNLKDQTEILVLNAPASFELELAALKGVAIRRHVPDIKAVAFSLAFVTTQKEVNALATAVGKKTQGDAVVWFAYPKGTSKKYTCEFNRDTGWAPLGKAGFEPVRMVAIDEDWSAVRFRRAAFIKTMTRDRSWAMSKEGKKKTANK